MWYWFYRKVVLNRLGKGGLDLGKFNIGLVSHRPLYVSPYKKHLMVPLIDKNTLFWVDAFTHCCIVTNAFRGQSLLNVAPQLCNILKWIYFLNYFHIDYGTNNYMNLDKHSCNVVCHNTTGNNSHYYHKVII